MNENRRGLYYLLAIMIVMTIAAVIIIWKSLEQGINGSMIGLPLIGALIITFFFLLFLAFLFNLRHED